MPQPGGFQGLGPGTKVAECEDDIVEVSDHANTRLDLLEGRVDSSFCDIAHALGD